MTVVLVGAVVSGCGVTGDKAGGRDSPEPVVLTLAHARDIAELRPFVDQVDRLSHGAVRIEPHTVPRTADEDDDATVFTAVVAGDADLGVISRVVSPSGLESPAAQEQAFRDGFSVETGLTDLHGIGALPGSLVRPAGVARPLLGPESYRDLQVAMPSDVEARTILAALGARTVPHNLRGEEVFTADAIVAPLADIVSNVYDGVVATVTANVVLGYQTLAIFAGPTDQRELLAAAAKAAIPASFALRRAEEAAAVTTLCRRGRVDLVTAAPEDLTAVRQALADLPKASAHPAEQPPALSCAGVAGDTASTLLDGVYEVSTHRITLARGQLTDADQRGTYAVHGDVLVLDYPPPADTIVYRWTLDHDRLMLSPVEGRNSPPALRSAPWRRVGDAPAAAQTSADGVYELTTGSGEFRWTLDRGQLHQVRDGGVTWARAGYTFDGGVLTATYAEIGGEPLTSAPVRPGETVRYRWNLYRGWLRLTPLDDAPAVFAGAWRRIGDPP